MNSAFLPAGWYLSGRWILDCIPLWGSNYLYRQKCAFFFPFFFFFFFSNKKTEGSWYVWIKGMKTSAQFQALGSTLAHTSKVRKRHPTIKSTRQYVPVKVHEGGIDGEVLKPTSSWVPWGRSLPSVSSVYLSASFLPLSLSLTCTRSGHTHNGMIFFPLIIRAKWVLLSTETPWINNAAAIRDLSFLSPGGRSQHEEIFSSITFLDLWVRGSSAISALRPIFQCHSLTTASFLGSQVITLEKMKHSFQNLI